METSSYIYMSVLHCDVKKKKAPPPFFFATVGLSKKMFKKTTGTSLVVQWLRLCAPNAGDSGLIPGQGTRSNMLEQRVHVSQLATKNPTCHT